MILRLMRLSFRPNLLIFLVITIVLPYFGLRYLINRISGTDAPVRFYLVCLPVPALLVLLRARQRATIFDLGLPIAGRTLFTANFLVTTTIIWASLLIFSGALLVSGDATEALMMMLVRMGLILTLGIAAIQSIAISRIAVPTSFVWLMGAAASGAIALLMNRGSNSLVLGSSAGATAILLARIFRRLPAAFEIAPKRESKSSGWNWAEWIPWMAGLRSFAPWTAWLLLLVCLPQLKSGDWAISTMLSVLILVQFSVSTPFLSSLPISRRKLLLIRLVPVLIVTLGGYFHEAYRLTNSPVVRMTAAFLITGGMLMGVFFLQKLTQRRRSGMRTTLRPLTVLVAVFLNAGWFVPMLIRSFTGPSRGSIEDSMLIRLASQMPANPWMTALLCIGVIAALYGLLDWQTRQLEVYALPGNITANLNPSG